VYIIEGWGSNWLDVDGWVQFRVCVQVYKCLHNMAPGYLSSLCQPVSSVPGCHHLRSAGHGELDFPRVNLSTYGGRVFTYTGPTSWNSVPDSLKNSDISLHTFKRHLNTFLFSSYQHIQRVWGFTKTCYMNSLLLLLSLFLCPGTKFPGT